MITTVNYYKMGESPQWQADLKKMTEKHAVVGSRIQIVKVNITNGIITECKKTGKIEMWKLTIHYEEYDRTQPKRDGTGEPRRRG